MAKARRVMSEALRLVDVVVELTDARIPHSSFIDVAAQLSARTRTVLALTKSDLADPDVTPQWVSHYAARGTTAVVLDAVRGGGIDALKRAIYQAAADKRAREQKRGQREQAIRMMIAGVPNVGKSTLINKLTGRAAVKTADKPGVTRSNQWVRIADGYELLDTPGILTPSLPPEQMMLLALTGSIRDVAYDAAELTLQLIGLLRDLYPTLLQQRYKLSDDDASLDNLGVLEAIGKKRGCLIKGGEVDYERVSGIVLDEFRSATIGRITLERPGDA